MRDIRIVIEDIEEDLEIIKHRAEAKQYGEVADRCLESENWKQTLRELEEEFGEDNLILNWAKAFLLPCPEEEERKEWLRLRNQQNIIT